MKEAADWDSVFRAQFSTSMSEASRTHSEVNLMKEKIWSVSILSH